MKLLKQTLVFLKANQYTVINVIIMLSNPWWWVIIKRDLGVSILVFALSIIFLYFFHSRSKIIILLLLVLTSLLIIISLRQGFDESILRVSAREEQQLNKRHEFYAHNLGKIYTNRISLFYFKNYSFSLLKLERNFFGNLDLNLYFFGSHPRERTGIDEFEKYMPIFAPFFLIGFIYSIFRPKLRIVAYFIIILFISSFISPYYNLGPILFFPLINFVITIGFLLSLESVLKYKKNV